MNHFPAVRVAEVRPRLIEHQVVVRRAVAMHDEDVAKALLSQVGGEVHEDRPERRAPHGVRTGKNVLPADLVRTFMAEGDRGEHQDGQPGARDDRLGEPEREPLVRIPVGEGRQMRPMLLQDPAREDDDRPLLVERPDLVGRHLCHPMDLSHRRRTWREQRDRHDQQSFQHVFSPYVASMGPMRLRRSVSSCPFAAGTTLRVPMELPSTMNSTSPQ
ncbi:MAG TPA: hypothetical protein VGF28_13715 [Thermoanaerobaculia bacterium]